MSSKIQNKLLQYEVQPPERLWNQLNAALDLEEQFSFRERVYSYEQLPPVNVWPDISAQLVSSEQKESVIVPFYKQYSRPLKFSGVAAALVIFAIVSSLLISKKSESEVPANKAVLAPIPTDKQKNTDARSSSGNATFSTDKMGPSRTAAILPDKITYQKASQASTLSFLNHFSPKIVQRARFSFNLRAEKYMIYSDAEGHAVRLPKKLFDAFACPKDNLVCKQRLKNLQEKLASSSITSDLTGLLEMLNNLQDNQ